MMKDRDEQIPGDAYDRELGLRPLTARSLLASMLLGTHPPRLPVAVLVAAADLFGISEGAARTALSRMIAAGEVSADDGWYALGPTLLARQQRQDAARRTERLAWDGTWRTLVVTVERRTATERSTARTTLTEARYAELREGVWARPDNLHADPRVVELTAGGWLAGSTRFDADPDTATLWPLAELSQTAAVLRAAVRELTPPLEQGDRALLRRGFIVAAAGLRLFRADPLLPEQLAPPSWPGAELREEYDRFDAAYRTVLRDFFREAAPRSS